MLCSFQEIDDILNLIIYAWIREKSILVSVNSGSFLHIWNNSTLIVFGLILFPYLTYV